MSRARALWVASAALGLAGCITSPENTPAPGQHTGYTDPAAFVQAYSTALQERNLNSYQKLLAGDFEYFPQAGDLENLPWLEGDSWGYVEEVGMIGHMMDPTFVPRDERVGPVRFVSARLTVVSQRESGGGSIAVTCHALISVRWGERDGAVSDVLFEMELKKADDGYLRLSALRELPVLGTAPREIERQTWAGLKACYRE